MSAQRHPGLMLVLVIVTVIFVWALVAALLSLGATILGRLISEWSS